MKYSLLILTLFFGLAVFSQTSDTYKGKTINVTDENNLKQGYWITFDSPEKNRIIEEGSYKDNKKEGIWKEYFQNGNVKSEITFVSGKADGYAKMYYENGNLQEEGVWKGTKWVGGYKFYHENGKPKYEFSYTPEGKRTGKQKYFHDNGALMIEGDWVEGKESGVIKEYYANGQLKSEKKYDNGSLDEGSVKNFAENTNVKQNDTKVVETKKDEVKENPNDKKNNQNTEVKINTSPTNQNDYKSYLSELAKKYPEGVTVENLKEGNNQVTRVIVVRSGVANEYKKIVTSYGSVLYSKNGQSTSFSVFNNETKK